jgi:hypothetical protein
MENKFVFSYKMYEVLSEDTQKYTGTALSGGEGGRAIRSTTTHYSDQRLWVKDLVTGKEKQFEFDTFNIAARPGHKLVCVWHTFTGELEAIKNISTDGTALGINDFSVDNVCTWLGIIGMSLLFGVLLLIPYFSAGLCFIGFLIGRAPAGDLKTRSLPFYRISLLIAGLFYVWLSQQIVEHFKAPEFFMFIEYVFIFNILLVATAYIVANNYVKTGRRKLRRFLNLITEDIKNTV